MDSAQCFWLEWVRETEWSEPDEDGTRSRHHIYRRSDTGEETTLRDAGPGAMWDAHWMGDAWKGPDGRCIVVKCPNGLDWMIDSRASNCTKAEDSEHQCWCRHGEVPNITVDKDCNTCDAGSGSIELGSGELYWHGFLRNGKLEPV